MLCNECCTGYWLAGVDSELEYVYNVRSGELGRVLSVVIPPSNLWD